MKKDNKTKQTQQQDIEFADEWGPMESITYNEKTGQPVPQPIDYDEIEY